jgi:beta-glucosidase
MTRSNFPFPDRPRLWGVAVSHYQVEGSDPCDWSDWEAAGRTRGGPCGGAVGSWLRYEEDGQLARDAGANAFRFSISWSRVEPRRGEFDDDALARYRQFVDHLRLLDIEPVVTLFHYTHPIWFHDRTPWTSPESVDAFARFARRVAEGLGESVRFYIPLNEPLVFLLAGYVDGQIPPGVSDTRLLARAFDNMLAAHVAAAASIREMNPDAAIGIAHNMMAFAPDRLRRPLDRLLARTADQSYNRGIVEAFSTGKWKFLLPPATMIRGNRADLTRSLDVFGVNFYSRLHLRFPGTERALGDFAYRDRSGRGFTDNGWEIVPEALGPLLDTAAESGLPLVVTENGIADANDRVRPEFIRRHVEEIRGAIERGIPIHGYFHWSLIDNFEWLDGFGPKFGLYEVDRTTLERRARASVQTFREMGRQFLETSR